MDENEEFEFRLRLEQEQSSKKKTPLELRDARGKALQSLPRSLAYGTDFKSAKENLGGLEDIEKGAYEAGGRVTDVTGSPLAGTAVRMLPDIASSILPAGPAKSAMVPLSNLASHELMFSALKPSAAGTASVAESMGRVKTMLEGGYNVSQKGVEKMHEKLSSLEGEIREILSKSPEKTSLADISAQGSKSREQFVLEKDQKTVDRVFNEIKQKYFPKGDLPVEESHLLKQRIYKNVKEKSYASGELQSAEKEGLMGAARGIRESELRAGVGPKLAEQQKLMDVLEPAEKRAIVELRNNPVGIALLAHNPKMMALYIGDRSSAFKSALANLINQSNVSGKIGGLVGVSLYELGNAGP